MANSLNKVQLIGNLGQDPEVRYTQDGKAVANFSIATSESWQDQQGQRQERTEWHRVVVFGRLAEIVQQYVRKGSKVFVEGQLRTEKWTDQQGQERYTTKIHLSGFNAQLIMLDSRRDGGGSYGGGAPGHDAPPAGGGYGAPAGGGYGNAPAGGGYGNAPAGGGYGNAPAGGGYGNAPRAAPAARSQTPPAAVDAPDAFPPDNVFDDDIPF